MICWNSALGFAPTRRRSRVQVIGSQFSRPGTDGDFGWMIEQPEYDDALFVFNDNEPQFLAFLQSQDPGSSGCRPGGGNAVIRPYRCKHPRRAAGVPTGAGEGYAQLTPEVKRVIDDAFEV